ncbi:MAG: hypothetical protein AMXMBFR82_20050 [Candidatus Hydrogenedentota bacterium]
MGDYFGQLYDRMAVAVESFCAAVFKPVLGAFFGPINDLLSRIGQPWFTITAIGFFLGTMLWVWLYLGDSYVNLGRQRKSIWTDLRVWTVISMLPHIFVYFYFY